MGGGSRKVSAASARSHTRKISKKSSSPFSSGMLRKIAVVLLIGILAWAYQAIRPPSPKICGLSDGPPITAPRIKLRDGRHLAYKEQGVPKDIAKYNIIFIHPFSGSRHDAILFSPEYLEEAGVHLVSFDRPGYGESDPHPAGTPKSLALDIEELADRLKFPSKFHVIGFSMGGLRVWGCLKYIPHRLAGAALLAPVINYWWPGFPANVSKEGYSQQLPQDQWAVWVAHHIPWLTYWWNTQKWFDSSSVVAENPDIFSPQDIEILQKSAARNQRQPRTYAKQQGEYESIHRDMIEGFGTWEFDPMENLENPFPKNEGSVHVWHGDDDRIVPVFLQRYIASRIPWIHYHEIPGAGHLFPFADGMSNIILQSLLFGEK